MLTQLGLFGLKILSYLPFQVLYIFSDALCLFLYYVIKYRRGVVSENLRNSFPEKTDQERKLIAKQFYGYMCDLIVETLKMITISREEACKRYKIINPELLEKYFKEKKSVIAAAGHYGNWEMGSNIGLTLPHKVLVVYKPLANKQVDTFIKKVRSRFQANLIPMKTAFKQILSYRREPVIAVLVSDQSPVPTDAHYYTNFLNQQTPVYLGIENLAKAYDYPVVFCDVKVTKRGYYTCEFVPLINEPKLTKEHEITEAHVNYLEQMIRKQPHYWIWSHKRWKRKPPAAAL